MGWDLVKRTFHKKMLGSSSNKQVRTVSAKIKDCHGLGLGQAYFLQMILGSSSHKKCSDRLSKN